MGSSSRSRALSPGLGLLLALAGGAALTLALARDRNAMQMLPGMDGCLTAGVLGFLLPVLHGLRYRVALALVVPIIGVQAIACRAVGGAFLPILGPELLAFGLLGVIPIPWLRRAEEASEPAVPETVRVRTTWHAA